MGFAAMHPIAPSWCSASTSRRSSTASHRHHLHHALDRSVQLQSRTRPDGRRLFCRLDETNFVVLATYARALSASPADAPWIFLGLLLAFSSMLTPRTLSHARLLFSSLRLSAYLTSNFSLVHSTELNWPELVDPITPKRVMCKVQRHRHDLLRANWLPTLKRIRWVCSDEVHFNGTVHTTVQFANSSSVHVMWTRLQAYYMLPLIS